MSVLDCGVETKASRRFQQRALILMGVYLPLVFLSVFLTRHVHIPEWTRYVLAFVPILPTFGVLIAMAKYLREETDEYVRFIAMRAMLAGTGALLGISAVNDFLRSLTQSGGLPPFAGWVAFFLVYATAQFIQQRAGRADGNA